MENAKKAQLISGSITQILIKLTVPMLFGILAMVAFNLVDTYFIGQLGTNELAAASFTFPVVLIINSIAMGLGMGASAVISRAIGQGDHRQVQRLTTDALVLGLLIVAFIAIIGLLTITPLFTLLGATPEIIPLIKEYMIIWYLGVLFVVIPMIGNNAIRATGDTKTPSLVMLVAVVVNLILDPLLIFGLGPVPAMGLRGAAIATVLSRAFTLVVAFYILYVRERMVTFVPPKNAEFLDSWKRILYIGVPAAGTNVVIPISTGIIYSIAARFGPEVVAGLGVASRIEMFALTVVMALATVLGPFVGQNWGAGYSDRVKEGIKKSQQFALLWGGIVFVLFLVFAAPVARLFSQDEVVIETIVGFMRVVSMSYGLMGVMTLSTMTLNVLNKPLPAAMLAILRVFILYVPLAFLGAYLFQATGIFWAASLSNILAGIAAYLWLKRTVERETATIQANKQHTLPSPEPVRAG